MTKTAGRVPTTNELAIRTDSGWLHATERPGRTPAVVMMHGFPGDSRIYSRLSPLLSPYRSLAFDWAGYGRSERNHSGRFDRADHQRQIAIALDYLGPPPVVLVAHDGAGPDVVDYVLDHSDRVRQVVLLNTSCGHAPALGLAEITRHRPEENLRFVTDTVFEDGQQRLTLPDPAGTSRAVPPVGTVRSHALAPKADTVWTGHRSHEGAKPDRPVSLIFGTRDEYFSPDLASCLTVLFRRAEVHLIHNASHWPQWDQPEAVARVIRRAASSGLPTASAGGSLSGRLNL